MKLPTPSKEELLRSKQLTDIIKHEIAQQHGWISFAKYMELALYAQDLGYYVADSVKFGKDGDFVTAPEISTLFGKTLAHKFAQQKERQQHILEFGAGSGALCHDILLELASLQQLPQNYYIIEASPNLIARQQSFLQQKLSQEIFAKITWLNTLPSTKSSAFVIANEILDAMPVQLFKIQAGNLLEVGVSVDKTHDSLMLQSHAPSLQLQQYLQQHLQQVLAEITEYSSECNLFVDNWLHDISDFLAQGSRVLILDYGFVREQYYHPERNSGTLMCHYRHTAHPDPLLYPGLQDITAHVDFTHVMHAAKQANLKIADFASQADFLLDNDVLSLVESMDYNSAQYLQYSQQLKTLLMPHEMGELIKVLELSK